MSGKAALTDAEILRICNEREAARRRKDFAEADELRESLRSHGVRTDDAVLRWTTGDGRSGSWGDGKPAAQAPPKKRRRRSTSADPTVCSDPATFVTGHRGGDTRVHAPDLRDGELPCPRGDWTCPKCGNKNWDWRDECNKCFVPHPTRKRRPIDPGIARADRIHGLDTGASFKGGDKRGVDDDTRRQENDQADRERKRRLEEEKKAAELRKKTKKRCAVCKRFTCIC